MAKKTTKKPNVNEQLIEIAGVKFLPKDIISVIIRADGGREVVIGRPEPQQVMVDEDGRPRCDSTRSKVIVGFQG